MQTPGVERDLIPNMNVFFMCTVSHTLFYIATVNVESRSQRKALPHASILFAAVLKDTWSHAMFLISPLILSCHISILKDNLTPHALCLEAPLHC